MPKAPRVRDSKYVSLHAVRPRSFEHPLEAQSLTHYKTQPDPRAEFAQRLIERWGLVVSEDGGEDSQGRAKMRRSTPEEIVKAACDTAEKAIDEFEKRGWIIDIPSIEELDNTIKEAEDTN